MTTTVALGRSQGDGTVTVKSWIITERLARFIEDEMGPPHVQQIIPEDAGRDMMEIGVKRVPTIFGKGVNQ